MQRFACTRWGFPAAAGGASPFVLSTCVTHQRFGSSTSPTTPLPSSPPKRLAGPWVPVEPKRDMQQRFTHPLINSPRFKREVENIRARRTRRNSAVSEGIFGVGGRIDATPASLHQPVGSGKLNFLLSNPLKLMVTGGQGQGETHISTMAQGSSALRSGQTRRTRGDDEMEDEDEQQYQKGKRGRGMLTIRRNISTEVEWIDVVSQRTTSLEDYRSGIAMLLMELGGIHETLIENAMESVLLPQTTLFNQCASIVLRTAVSDTTPDMDSIQELTNRLTIIVMTDRNLVITIHRPEMDFLDTIRADWEAKHSHVTKIHLLNMVIKRCAKTYQDALAKSIVLFDEYESKLFVPQKQRSQLARQIYHIKRRASVYSRILALLFESYTHLTGILQIPKYDVFIQDVAQHIAHIRSLSDELNDNAQAVLQLLFQLSSYQLNELMRVLTMFSAFFIPLTFVTGTFGMNFEYLPGTGSEYGPLCCFAFMALISAGLMTWFRVKGFW